MAPEELFILNGELSLKSYTFYLYFIRYLHVWIRIHIGHTDPDPQSSRKRNHYGSGSTTLGGIYK